MKARFMGAALLALGWGSVAQAQSTGVQSLSSATETVAVGAGGASLSFLITWASDDAPQFTQSAPGRIDVIDGSGATVGSLIVTATGQVPSVTAGLGTVSGVQAAIEQSGAQQTPADGTVAGLWSLSGLAPGTYTLQFWSEGVFNPAYRADTIWTAASDAGSAAAQGSAPPTVALSVPAGGVVGEAVSLGATAAAGAPGAPIQSLVLSVSTDTGATWSVLGSAAAGTTPAAAAAATGTWTALHAGPLLVRAVATATDGGTGEADQSMPVGPASQPAPTLTPAGASLAPGQTVTFEASGGATGNYAWSGAQSGSGAALTFTGLVTGSFVLSVIDSGNADYLPSPPASAALTVNAGTGSGSGGTAATSTGSPPPAVAAGGGTPAQGGSSPPAAGGPGAGGPSGSPPTTLLSDGGGRSWRYDPQVHPTLLLSAGTSTQAATASP